MQTILYSHRLKSVLQHTVRDLGLALSLDDGAAQMSILENEAVIRETTTPIGSRVKAQRSEGRVAAIALISEPERRYAIPGFAEVRRVRPLRVARWCGASFRSTRQPGKAMRRKRRNAGAGEHQSRETSRRMRSSRCRAVPESVANGYQTPRTNGPRCGPIRPKSGHRANRVETRRWQDRPQPADRRSI